MHKQSRREFLGSVDGLREDSQSLINIPVERTMVGGRWVFEA